MEISKCSHRLCYVVDCDDHSHAFTDALVHAYLYRNYEPAEDESDMLRAIAAAIYVNAGSGLPMHDCIERGCLPVTSELN